MIGIVSDLVFNIGKTLYLTFKRKEKRKDSRKNKMQKILIAFFRKLTYLTHMKGASSGLDFSFSLSGKALILNEKFGCHPTSVSLLILFKEGIELLAEKKIEK